jgi:hypothetical protein
MTSLNSLVKKKNHARDELLKFITENDHERRISRKLLQKYESRFVKIWEKYSIEYYQNQEFFSCCEYMVKCIHDEKYQIETFEKLYKPYLDKYEKLIDEHKKLKQKLKKSKTSGEKPERIKK